MTLNSELREQKKIVMSLKKKYLWSKKLEEVIEKLVDIIVFIMLVLFYTMQIVVNQMDNNAAYNIGGLVISADAIEHLIFGFLTTRVGGWLKTILSTAFRKKCAEEKQFISLKPGLPNSQSAVCFALCTGAFSDPVGPYLMFRLNS